MQEPKAVKQAAFPVWAPLLMMAAVILTGAVLGREEQVVPHTHFILFAIAAIVMTILVEVRGLFLTVFSIPIYFVVGTIFIGWTAIPKEGMAGKKALLLSCVYPAITHFLWLLFPLIAAGIIALVRWWLFQEYLSRRAAYQAHLRRRSMAAERHNRQTYTRARATHVARPVPPPLPTTEKTESELGLTLRKNYRY